MPILDLGDPRLGTDMPFFSPFPSNDAQKSAMFKSLISEVESLPGAPPEGIMASKQSAAFTLANQAVMRVRFTSIEAGGLRSDWLPEVLGVAMKGGLQQVRGMFGNVTYARTTDPGKLTNNAAEIGLDIAQNVLSAVPVFGNILSAAVGFGRMIWKLLSGNKEEEAVKVPWEEFSQDVDQDVVNGPLKTMFGGTDLTPLFAPALDAGLGFRIMETKKGGETRAYGTFSDAGNPVFVGGFGMLPGTERLTQVIQIGNVWKGTTDRRDAVTDVGSFLPSTSQFGTGVWAQVNRAGNPDMYKVRAGELLDEWDAYWEAFFGNAWEQWNSVSDFSRLFMAKALAKWIYILNSRDVEGGMSWKSHGSPINLDEFHYPYINPDVFNPSKFVHEPDPGAEFRPFYNIFARPQIKTLKQRQKSMLARSLVCALVRFEEVDGMPPFAAFADKSAPLSPGYATFGEELTDYCKEMRQILLTHPERYKLSEPVPGSLTFERYAPDVRDVDPKFAAKLEPTLVGGLPLKAREPMGLAVAPLEPDAPEPEGAEGPGGGPPFPPPPPERLAKTLNWLLPVVAGTTFAASLGGALWLQREG